MWPDFSGGLVGILRPGGSREGVLWELSIAYKGIFITRVKRENTDLTLGLVTFSEP